MVDSLTQAFEHGSEYEFFTKFIKVYYQDFLPL